MTRETTLISPMLSIESRWKHGSAAVATLGDRISLAMLQSGELINYYFLKAIPDSVFPVLAGEIGKPVTLNRYAEQHDITSKYYFTTGRALAGFMAKNIHPRAVREAATSTCVQFDGLHPPSQSKREDDNLIIPVKDGCRAPSEAVDIWMANGRSGEAVTSGFSTITYPNYYDQTRRRRHGFMLDLSPMNVDFDTGVVSAFNRFAKAYPEQFSTMFNGVPKPCKEAIVESINQGARAARESGIEARADKMTKIVRSTVADVSKDDLDFFTGTSEPVVAYPVVERLAKIIWKEKEKRKWDFIDRFAKKVEETMNPVITRAAIKWIFTPQNQKRFPKSIQCGFLRRAEFFGPKSITSDDKEDVEKIYKAFCGS